MNCCLESAIRDISIKFKVERRTKGAYEKGRWVDRDPEIFDVCGSIQVARPDDLLRLEEGRRTGEAIRIYTTTLLMTTDAPDCEQADVVIYNSERYEVEAVANWTVDGGYYRVIAVKETQ